MKIECSSLNRILIICQDDLESIPYHRVFPVIDYLKSKIKYIDVLYYDRAYDKEVASIGDKFREGFNDFFRKPRVSVKSTENVTYYGIRRLPLDGIPSTILQDPWIFRQFRKVNKARYDLCISEAPGPARIARWMKKNGFARYFVYDDTDYFPGFASGWRAKTILLQEKKGTKSADLVICIGNRLAQLRAKDNIKNIRVIPNGVFVSRYQKGQIKKPHPPTLVYVGALADWLGLEILIEQFPPLLKTIPTLRFLIIGDGPKRQFLDNLVKSLQLQNHVFLKGQKTPVEVVDYLSESDIGIILPKPSILWEYACPIKLFEYTAAGLPTLATGIGELQELVDKYKIGCALPYIGPSWTDAILRAFNSPDWIRQFSHNTLTTAPLFDWSVLMEQYYNAIMNLSD